MRLTLSTLVAAGALAVSAGPASGSAPSLAPLPNDVATSTHGPFEAGACDTCHQRADKDDPGEVVKVGNDLCFDCHDEFASGRPVQMDKATHTTSKARCVTCHTPHNSRKRKLLL